MWKQSSLWEKSRQSIRDDVLAIIRLNQSGRTSERLIKPKLNAVFNSERLNITIDPASQVIDYLDVKFNLKNHTHEPYRKPYEIPSYIHVNSNHPKHIIRHVPKMIEQILSSLSSNKEIFERNKATYQKALNDSGYKYELQYQEPKHKKRRKRSRRAKYFNPPFCKSVSTNIVK